MSSFLFYPMNFRASKIYPRRVGRIKWKENIWTRISACSDVTIWLETSSSCKFRIASAGGSTDLGYPVKCDSIGDEIGADQDWGKLQKNRDRSIPCIRFYRLPFLLLCRGNFYSPSSSSTRFKLDLRSVFRSLRGEYSILFSILKNSGFWSTLTIYWKIKNRKWKSWSTIDYFTILHFIEG